MNLKHVNSNIWTKLALTSYSTAIIVGIYGRSRTNFSNDFVYNVYSFLILSQKYHFGVLVNFLSGLGLFLSAKVPHSWHCGFLFLGATALASIPAYYEGYKDMKNQEIERSTAGYRKLGFNLLVGGFAVLIMKHRGLIK